MAKLTLLQMVQSILSDMDSDEVNSISDTVEAAQVASTIKDVYFQLIETEQIPELKELFTLTALGDTTKPNYMLFPDDVNNVQWIKYNVKTALAARDQFTLIHWCEPTEFMNRVHQRDSTDTTNIQTVTDFSGVPLYIDKNKSPEFWTTFDDNYVVFDSYLSTLDTTLQASKSVAFGQKSPTWTGGDDFVPDLDDTLFPFLLAESKSTCFFNLKQTANSKIDKQARDQKYRSQNDKHRLRSINFRNVGPNYGRRNGRRLNIVRFGPGRTNSD